MKKLLATAVIMSFPGMAFASGVSQCEDVRWRPGDVLKVNSAVYIGTRIEFPSNLVADVANSNPELWDVSSAANQVLIKPNSETPNGSTTMLHAFTEDGKAFDIMVDRSTKAHSDVCVTINTDSQLMSNQLRSGLQTYAAGEYEGSPQYQAAQQEAAKNSRSSVKDALQRYRYHIYTRYSWDKGSGFSGEDIISDVYDDGRWTYIRVARNNRGIFSVIAEVGGKEAIVPSQYDDSYGIYRISGIYPEFTLKLNESTIHVSREDNSTHGES